MVAALPEDYELLEIKNTEGRFTVCRYRIELVVTWIPASAGMTDRHLEQHTVLSVFASKGPKFIHSISSYKSRHWRFVISINLIFQTRFHSLIAFSRAMAVCMDSHCSYQTSM
jgi:hypothetical protein